MRPYSANRERKAALVRSARHVPVLTVRPSPVDARKGHLNAGGVVFPCALGKGGISFRKREGDGATPLAAMRILGGYFRNRPSSGQARRCDLALLPIRPDLGWCDEASDRNYNRAVRLPYRASHERMMRDDHLYDVCLVLDWNMRPRRRGCGSAIFLHVARAGYQPTEGCIAVSRATMRRLLPILSRRTVVRVVI